MNDVNDKSRLRREARARRWISSQAVSDSAAESLRDNFLAAHRELAIPLTGGRLTVAGYWPMGSEVDPRALMRHMHDEGARCVLPVVVTPNAPLVFRVWAPGEPLVEGDHGTRHPPESAEQALPDLVLTPLVAFDEEGYRLGQGKGYYDRTLEALRRDKEIVAVGLAYESQVMSSVPRAPHDQPLNWIITEKRAIQCR